MSTIGLGVIVLVLVGVITGTILVAAQKRDDR